MNSQERGSRKEVRRCNKSSLDEMDVLVQIEPVSSADFFPRRPDRRKIRAVSTPSPLLCNQARLAENKASRTTIGRSGLQSTHQSDAAASANISANIETSGHTVDPESRNSNEVYAPMKQGNFLWARLGSQLRVEISG